MVVGGTATLGSVNRLLDPILVGSYRRGCGHVLCSVAVLLELLSDMACFVKTTGWFVKFRSGHRIKG